MKKVFAIFILFSAIVGGLSSVSAQNFVKVTKGNSGQTINLSNDQVLEIRLPQTPSNGYIWCESNNPALKTIPKTIVQIEDADFVQDAVPSNSLGRKSLKVGLSGTQIIKYIGTSAGTTELTLELRRPWEKGVSATDIFTLTIVSGGKYAGTYKSPLKAIHRYNTLLTSVSSTLPSSWDWRSQCTPIANQMQCGDCWAFASCGTLECNILIKDGVTRDISEEFVTNCFTANSCNGCSGGGCAHEAWMAGYTGANSSGGGAVYESEDAWTTSEGTGVTGSCGAPYAHHETIDSYRDIGGENAYNVPPVDSIKNAIYNYGPILAGVDASNITAWSNYSGGIWVESSPTGTSDHAICLVGWKDTTVSDGSGGYWILRNSWGTGWGVGGTGYMYISYGSDIVGCFADYLVYEGGIHPAVLTGCDTTYPSALMTGTCNDSLALYGMGTNLDTGYIAGQNAYGFSASAERFPAATSSANVSGVMVYWAAKIGSTGNTSASIYTVAANGAPGTLLGTSNTITKNLIDTAHFGINSHNFYTFSSPPSVGTSPFFVVINYPTTFTYNSNELGMLTLNETCSSLAGDSTGWFDYSSYGWMSYKSGFGVNFDLMIFPVVCAATITDSASASPTLICSGTSSTLNVVASGSSSYTYSWSSSPAGFTSTLQSPTVSPTVTTTYIVTATSGSLTATSSVVVTVNPSPSITITSTTNLLCYGENNGSATISVSGGTPSYTYSWSTTPIQTTVTATGLIAGIYTVTVTDANSCTKTAHITITQPPVLGASISSHNNVSCFGGNNGSATVSASGGTPSYNYLWNTTPVQSTATATGLTPGTYTVTVTDANSCTNTASVTITQPATALAANISAQTNVTCFGGNNGTATVSASGGTPSYSYLWNTIPVQSTVTATGLIAGTYTVTVTDANSCTKTASITITQPPTLLTVNITSQTNDSCYGDNNGNATVSASGGIPAYTYSWNTTPVQTTVTATGLYAGAYTVTVTDANGCSKTAFVAISQPLAINVNAGPDTIICYGSTITLGGAPTASGGSGSFTYSWNPTTGLSSTNVANPTANPTSTTSYSVYVTDANNCTNSASITVTVNLYPGLAVTPTGTITLCQNSPNTIYTTIGATNATSYGWFVYPISAGTIIGTGTNGTINWDSTFYGTAYIYVKGINGPCDGPLSDSLAVTVLQGPPATITAHGSTTFCQGDSLILTANYAAGLTYQWQMNSSNISGATDTLIVVKQSGNYSVVVTNANNCSAITSVMVTVNPNPTVNVSASENPICADSSTILTANGATTYSWDSGLGTANPLTVMPTTTTTYTVTGTTAGCTGTASVTINVNPVPPIPTITQNVLTLMSSSATGNQWFFNGNPISGATSQFYTVTQDGFYTVEVTNSYGCSSISSPLSVANVGIQEYDLSNYIKIYPNPANDNLTIESTLQGIIEVTDIQGQLIETLATTGNKTNIDVSALAKGMYFVKVKTDRGVESRKFVKL